MISNNPTFIFVHIHKTAGVSVEAVLEKYRSVPTQKNHNHAPIINIKKSMDDEQFNKSFKFGFVRNPWDRMYSYYNYYKQIYPLTKDKMQNVSFKEFIIEPHHLDWKFQNGECFYGGDMTHFCQLNWLVDETGKIIVDFVGKFENINDDFVHVMNELNLNIKLPHKNKSSHGSYRDVYDNEMIDIVTKRAMPDIEYFGYDF